MKVGIFDSGIGGITVLKTALRLLPQVDYIYYSDNNHVPYGTKSKEEVFGYVMQVVEFLIKEQVDAIVIACNTATSIAVDALRLRYSIPIIGMEPAVKLAMDNLPKGKILVTATPLALKEEKYKRLVNGLGEQERIYSLALPELVGFAENYMFDEKLIANYFHEKLAGFDLEEITGIVLGCTHFVYFRKQLQSILPKHIQLFDGNEGTIKHLKELIVGSNEPLCYAYEKPRVTFYYSGQCCQDHTILERYLNLLEHT